MNARGMRRSKRVSTRRNWGQTPFLRNRGQTPFFGENRGQTPFCIRGGHAGEKQLPKARSPREGNPGQSPFFPLREWARALLRDPVASPLREPVAIPLCRMVVRPVPIAKMCSDPNTRTKRGLTPISAKRGLTPISVVSVALLLGGAHQAAAQDARAGDEAWGHPVTPWGDPDLQ